MKNFIMLEIADRSGLLPFFWVAVRLSQTPDDLYHVASESAQKRYEDRDQLLDYSLKFERILESIITVGTSPECCVQRDLESSLTILLSDFSTTPREKIAVICALMGFLDDRIYSDFKTLTEKYSQAKRLFANTYSKLKTNLTCKEWGIERSNKTKTELSERLAILREEYAAGSHRIQHEFDGIKVQHEQEIRSTFHREQAKALKKLARKENKTMLFNLVNMALSPLLINGLTSAFTVFQHGLASRLSTMLVQSMLRASITGQKPNFRMMMIRGVTGELLVDPITHSLAQQGMTQLISEHAIRQAVNAFIFREQSGSAMQSLLAETCLLSVGESLSAAFDFPALWNQTIVPFIQFIQTRDPTALIQSIVINLNQESDHVHQVRNVEQDNLAVDEEEASVLARQKSDSPAIKKSKPRFFSQPKQESEKFPNARVELGMGGSEKRVRYLTTSDGKKLYQDPNNKSRFLSKKRFGFANAASKRKPFQPHAEVEFYSIEETVSSSFASAKGTVTFSKGYNSYSARGEISLESVGKFKQSDFQYEYIQVYFPSARAEASVSKTHVRVNAIVEFFSVSAPMPSVSSCFIGDKYTLNSVVSAGVGYGGNVSFGTERIGERAQYYNGAVKLGDGVMLGTQVGVLREEDHPDCASDRFKFK